MYYPRNFAYGTGAGTTGSWDTNDDEAMPENVSSRHWCSTSGHRWVDTGMKWTYCSACDVEGEWTMAHGYGVSTRRK